jgi:predicted branched-subunit amino acid permease
MFLTLLTLQVRKRSQLAVAVLTGVLAALLLHGGMTRMYIIVATVIGATVGVVLEQWTRS